MTDKEFLPEHIGIIMDGNGRWAKQRGLPRNAGHKKGAEVFKKIARYCRDIGIKYLTVYAFSTENWKRPQEEIDGIMNLLRNFLKDMEIGEKEHIKVKFIGNLEPIANDIKELIYKAEKANDELEDTITVQIALNYGGRDEIVHAVQMIVEDISNGDCDNTISEKDISDRLYSLTPECDLIIRPSGEQRISNFLLWESAYSEFVYMDVLWPDFTTDDLDDAIAQFRNRHRRFGGV